MLEGRTYPVDINAEGLAVNIQVGRRGHKVWICTHEGQAIVRINGAADVTIEDLRDDHTDT